MPPPSGGKLKASSRVVPKLPRHHLRFERAQVPDHAVPVVIGLDRAPARGPHAPRELVVRQQATDGVAKRRRILRGYEEAGLAVAHRVRHATRVARDQDRKSTRLNSSHGSISYAVFCLKKKKNKNTMTTTPRNA